MKDPEKYIIYLKLALISEDNPVESLGKLSAGQHPGIPVKRRFIQRRKDGPPCEGDHQYSVNNGRTWMSLKQYNRFKELLIYETWK